MINGRYFSDSFFKKHVYHWIQYFISCIDLVVNSHVCSMPVSSNSSFPGTIWELRNKHRKQIRASTPFLGKEEWSHNFISRCEASRELKPGFRADENMVSRGHVREKRLVRWAHVPSLSLMLPFCDPCNPCNRWFQLNQWFQPKSGWSYHSKPGWWFG